MYKASAATGHHEVGVQTLIYCLNIILTFLTHRFGGLYVYYFGLGPMYNAHLAHLAHPIVAALNKVIYVFFAI